jgi:hypothetical protein
MSPQVLPFSGAKNPNTGMLCLGNEVSPIGRNSGVLIGGEPHQNSVSRVSSNSGGFCAAKTDFDGLSSVVLVRF